VTFPRKKISTTQKPSKKVHPAGIHAFKHSYFYYFKETIYHHNSLPLQGFGQVSKT